MTLTLNVLRCPDAVPPETRTVRGGEFSIGRGADNDWVLPDPERHLSKRHCMLAFRSGQWQLADTSTNGTFLNRDLDPVGQGTPRDLRDGDRLRLGAYEIEVRIEEEPMQAGGFGQPSAFGQAPGRAGGPRDTLGDPFGDDPFKAPAPPRTGNPFHEEPLHGPGGDPFGGGIGPAPVALPPDFDPLAPGLDMPLGAPTQPDHTPAFSDAFQPPRPAAALIPDDWDLGIGPAAPPPQPAAPVIAPPMPPPLAPPPIAAPPTPPAAGPPVDFDAPSPFDEPTPLPPAVPVAAPAPTATPVPTAAPAAPQHAGLMAAFLRGVEMPDVEVGDAAAKMEALGAAFRALVGGLRRVLIARAAIKGEFRIEQTMIRARGNNPLKFSTGDDDALAALLGAGRRSDMAPAAAVADALRDIRLHELASMVAMQSAVRALLARFDPAALRAAADQQGGISLPGARKGRAWDEFEKLHASTTQALTDDFDSVFGKAFARAYEQALDEAAAKEKDT
ncbi:type VI secretion system-associated FHA domain protein TagH [Limobrevibacterium gyesilva]|uniref:Type VI secretion system-associated FHA domain protein TagH n=1 Tax=Limobrevibacterium gyesilva TaxID=2991712 RepID=A0AA41YKA7_9PROT|nr:type VI secretion system-associated FHA domain protein TagH [Limobrevibacterium gyesilva]MCW3473906.1 type VI secretion system-associated FHA domain protein TagH [Limobrevibacterium gyesilva]